MCGRFTITRRDRTELAAMLGVPESDLSDFFAGLFEAWQPQPGEWRTTFTIITTTANRKIEPEIFVEVKAPSWTRERVDEIQDRIESLEMQRRVAARAKRAQPNWMPAWRKRKIP
jgi:hypothetical protein